MWPDIVRLVQSACVDSTGGENSGSRNIDLPATCLHISCSPERDCGKSRLLGSKT